MKSRAKFGAAWRVSREVLPARAPAGRLELARARQLGAWQRRRDRRDPLTMVQRLTRWARLVAATVGRWVRALVAKMKTCAAAVARALAAWADPPALEAVTES